MNVKRSRSRFQTFADNIESQSQSIKRGKHMIQTITIPDFTNFTPLQKIEYKNRWLICLKQEDETIPIIVIGQKTYKQPHEYNIANHLEDVIDNYVGDIGHVPFARGPNTHTFLIVDASISILSISKDDDGKGGEEKVNKDRKKDKNLIIGFANFIDSQNKDTGEIESEVKIIGIHPSYQKLGNLGCILMNFSEFKLKQYYQRNGWNMKSKILLISLLSILLQNKNYLDDGPYKFYWRQGYRPKFLLQGQIYMEKKIPLYQDHYDNDIKDYRFVIPVADIQCTRNAIEFEIKDDTNAIKMLEKLLVHPPISHSFGRFDKYEVKSHFDPTSSIFYMKQQRNINQIDQHIKELQDKNKNYYNNSPEIQDKILKLLELRQLLITNPHAFDDEYNNLLEEMKTDEKRFDQEYKYFEDLARKEGEERQQMRDFDIFKFKHELQNHGDENED